MNMHQSTRAKFHVHHIERTSTGATVKLHPVYGDSKENRHFWSATPSGEITLHITNKSAVDTFEEGGEYYVDFTRAS